MLKKVGVIGFAGLALGVSPAAAESVGDGSVVALTMAGGLGVTSIGCLAIALLTSDDEDDEKGYDRRGVYVALSPSYARQNFTDTTIVDLVDGDVMANLRDLRGTPRFVGQDPPVLVDPGFYTVDFGDIEENVFGFTGRAGYRCHPNISFELQFEWLDDFDGTIVETQNSDPLAVGAPQTGVPPDSLRVLDLKFESLVFTTNAKAYLLTGRYQPFLLAGVGFMRVEAKTQDKTGGTIQKFAPHGRTLKTNLAFRLGGGVDFYLSEHVVASAEVSYLMPTSALDGLDYYSIGVGLQYRF